MHAEHSVSGTQSTGGDDLVVHQVLQFVPDMDESELESTSDEKLLLHVD